MGHNFVLKGGEGRNFQEKMQYQIHVTQLFARRSKYLPVFYTKNSAADIMYRQKNFLGIDFEREVAFGYQIEQR